MFKFKLGDKVKDRITGFVGVVIARTEWYNGCIRYNIASAKLHEGKTVDETFDEAQLEVTGKPVPPKRDKETTKRPGGPHPAASQRTVLANTQRI